MDRELPSGRVTLLFTDIEGSTRLLGELGAEAYEEALTEHRRLLRGVFARRGGVEVDTQGDAFFYAFPSAPEAIDAAREGQEALLIGPIRVRMGMHTGAPHVGSEGYVGEEVHLAARIAAAGHGGQVLVSETTRVLVDQELADLGEHRLKDFPEPVWIFQLGQDRFPPLKTISNTNLPRPASSFVGREREVLSAARQLRAGGRRGRRARRPARGVPEPPSPGDEQGAVAHPGRGGVPGAAARAIRVGRALLCPRAAASE